MYKDRLVHLTTPNLYKIIVSITLGIIGFIGVFYSSRFDFNGFSINFIWSMILPILVTLAWGIKYGLISISLIISYPFIVGSYNGWASFVPAVSLLLLIIIHGYGAKKRIEKQSFFYHIYSLQLIYILMRFCLYLWIFPMLIQLNSWHPPFWSSIAYGSLGIDIIMLFAIKGIIVETIFIALCDALLLLPIVRKLFRLECSKGAKYNTRIITVLVAFGLFFSLIILWINNFLIEKNFSINWLMSPNENTRITILLTTILFFIMGGITVRYIQRMIEIQEELKFRESQLGNAIEEIETLNNELEQRVVERTEELQHAVTELEGFAYTISHDLKSPLRAIDGYSSIIKEDYGDTLHTEANEMIGGIQQISKDMIGLINRLLEYSTTSKAALFKEQVEMAQLIEKVFHECKMANSDRKIELQLDGELPTVYVDKILFKQLITNILSNSIKFTKEREIATITVGYYESFHEGVFYIKDNGVGFDMKYASKLFHVFQRLHRKQDFEGTGIGLATIKKIIQKHDGKVWIEGRLDQGASIYFTLPSIHNEMPEEASNV